MISPIMYTLGSKRSCIRDLFEYGLTPDAAMVNVIGKLLPTGFNAAVAIIAAPLLAVTIRKALEHNRISLN